MIHLKIAKIEDPYYGGYRYPKNGKLSYASRVWVEEFNHTYHNQIKSMPINILLFSNYWSNNRLDEDEARACVEAYEHLTKPNRHTHG